MGQPEVASSQIGIRQFRSGRCLSYFLFDRSSRDAIVIDPHLSLMEDYWSFIADRQLKLSLAVDTHLQDDHYSATHLFHSEKGVPIAMSHQTMSSRVTKKLSDRDLIQVGSICLQVLEAPGYSSDSISLYGGGVVFSGDSLWIGSQSCINSLQKETVLKVFDQLPDTTVVFPAHDSNDFICSLIQVERKQNSAWRAVGEVSYEEPVAHQGKGKTQNYILFNQQLTPGESGLGFSGNQGALSASSQDENIRVVTMSIEKYKNKLDEGHPDSAFVDVREESEFRTGSIPGTRNIPLSEIGLHWAELSRFKRVYVSCQSGHRSWRVAKTLNYMGLQHVVDVSGGFSAWTNAGFPIGREMA